METNLRIRERLESGKARVVGGLGGAALIGADFLYFNSGNPNFYLSNAGVIAGVGLIAYALDGSSRKNRAPRS